MPRPAGRVQLKAAFESRYSSYSLGFGVLVVGFPCAKREVNEEQNFTSEASVAGKWISNTRKLSAELADLRLFTPLASLFRRLNNFM